MGRGKVEMKRIENKINRQATFSKRRSGQLKKAHELAVLCDAHLGVVVFSGTGKLFEYCSPDTSWSELIQRYDSITNGQLQGTDQGDDQVQISRLRRERDQLEARVRKLTGDDLSPLSTKELDNLQKHHESALDKVRERKDELLKQQLDESRHRVRILEEQNNLLCRMINEDGHHRAAAEAPAVVAEGTALPAMLFGSFFPEVEEELSTSLQLWPQQVLPSTEFVGFFPEVDEELSTSPQLW